MDEIETLRKLADKLEQERNMKYKGKKVLGFTITQTTNGNGSLQWRAYKYYKGKQGNIYLGKDPLNAKRKILEWVEKHPHFLPVI